MKRVMRFVFVAVALAASGCTLTLNSLFTDKDVTYDSALEGSWKTADATWVITPFDKPTGRYVLKTTMKEQPPAEFCAVLGTIGTNRFIELFPKRPDALHAKTFFGSHFITLRSFWKVMLDGDALTLTSMSFTWLDTKIKQEKVSIGHEKQEGGMMFLTASTKDLQDFVARYADDPGAFPSKGDEKGMVFTRSTAKHD